MQGIKFIGVVTLVLILTPGWGRAQTKTFTLDEASFGLPHLIGKKDNSGYPCVTAGDRLYAIGDQAGGFPAIGFHVEGQMGGIWQQPIKLLNGYWLTIRETGMKGMKTAAGQDKGMGGMETTAGKGWVLDKCDSYVAGSFVSRFNYQLPSISVVRTEFVPDGIPLLVVEYVFKNESGAVKDISVDLNVDVNLMPVWLGERSGMIDSTDEVVGFDKKGQTVYFRDKGNAWYAGVGFESPDAGSLKPVSTGVAFDGAVKSVYRGKGIGGKLTTAIHIPGRGSVHFRFYISGSTKDTTEIRKNIALVKGSLSSLFAAKRERYRQLEATAAIDIPDTALRLAYQWGKYSSDWLVRDVPGMGRAMSAGLPDYPWFFSNDQAYTFKALAGTVKPDIFYSSWKMLQHISDSVNDRSGRIIHEASTNGSVYDKGRMEESQLYIIGAWNIYKWTGNRDFLKTYYEHGGRVWKWLQQHDTDHNSYIEGYGGVEIEGLNAEMLDVQVRTQDFLRVMGEMAAVLQDPSAAAEYRQRADALRAKINADWWIPSENRYADFISSREKAISIIDSALVKRTNPGRNAWAVRKLETLRAKILAGEYTDKGYTVYYNTAGILPLEDGMADTARAMQMLANISFFSNRFGLYITGIERPDDVRIDEGSFRKDREFNYGRAVMPAATASLVIAACRYEGPDSALRYIHKILNSFGYATPGTTYEVSPDYGMFVQAWNIRGLNIPLIHFFFGIDPMAAEKRIDCRPSMPTEWDHASIKNVLIGTGKFSMDYKKTSAGVTYTMHCSQDGWAIDCHLPVGASAVRVNGKVAVVKDGTIRLTGRENIVHFIGK